MRTTARNHFHGTIVRIAAGAVNDEVELELAGGQRIVAVVTRESAETLGLAVGKPVFALIKASSVIVVIDLGNARLSARNQLLGRVAKVQLGAVNAEVVIAISEAVAVAAIVTQESAGALQLAVGMSATAMFKASSVLLGVVDAC